MLKTLYSVLFFFTHPFTVILLDAMGAPNGEDSSQR